MPRSSHRRLQRPADFTGSQLSSFRDVVLRHGLPGLLLALGFFCVPGLRDAFWQSLEKAAAAPAQYVTWFCVICLALNLYAWHIDRQWSVQRLGWIIYLAALSFWEEWVFRLAIPQTLEGMGTSVELAVLFSALLFGGLHYFTLRWKWQWCALAFLGSLALSRQMEMHDDLLRITAFHWIATFLNTPRVPGRPARHD